MTRKLECKAASRVLKEVFLTKGMRLPHTEALDILARLEGYEAWSHMKATKRKAGDADTLRLPAEFSFADLLVHEFGAWHSHPKYPIRDWEYAVGNNDTRRGYLDWLLYEHLVHDVPELDGTMFRMPDALEVTLPDGSKTNWLLETNLSAADGVLNTHSLETKPGIVGLMLNDALYEELMSLMVSDDTYITRMNGLGYGLLFEAEYLSEESDDLDGSRGYRPYAQMVESLCLRVRQDLSREFPDISFCVPPASQVYAGRPALWAFLPLAQLKAMSKDMREALAYRMAGA